MASFLSPLAGHGALRATVKHVRLVTIFLSALALAFTLSACEGSAHNRPTDVLPDEGAARHAVVISTPDVLLGIPNPSGEGVIPCATCHDADVREPQPPMELSDADG